MSQLCVVPAIQTGEIHRDSVGTRQQLVASVKTRHQRGTPGGLARRELHMPDLAKPDGYKLILVFLVEEGYKKDALDRRLLANRRF